MSESQKRGGIVRRALSQTRQAVQRGLPDRWSGRVDMLRAMFIKDGHLQFKRLATYLEYFRQFRAVDRSLHGHRYATCILLCHRTGLLEALLDGPVTTDELARRTGLDVQAVANLLPILESQEIARPVSHRWEATEFATHFFDVDSPVSIVPMLEVCEAYAQSYPDLVEAARTGERPPLLDVYDERGRIDGLLSGVNYYIDQAARELFVSVDLPEIEHFIVGSMGVSFSALVLEVFPKAQVTYGCLPHLAQRIPRLCEEYDIDSSRIVEIHDHGGEPARDQWGREAFDLVFLTKKMILDPDNDLGVKFAEKSHQVLNPGGVAVFWETIYDDQGPTPLQRALEGFFDFGVSPTGPVLTGAGFTQMLRDVGFRQIRVLPCLEGATTFVVARK